MLDQLANKPMDARVSSTWHWDCKCVLSFLAFVREFWGYRLACFPNPVPQSILKHLEGQIDD